MSSIKAHASKKKKMQHEQLFAFFFFFLRWGNPLNNKKDST
jgi:hypothetical protein